MPRSASTAGTSPLDIADAHAVASPCCSDTRTGSTQRANTRPLPDVDPERFASLCKALGHPARVRIVAHLAALDSCVCGRIVDILPLAQSTVSQHLKVLRQAGIVRGEVEGPSTCYCLTHGMREAFHAMADALALAHVQSQEGGTPGDRT